MNSSVSLGILFLFTKSIGIDFIAAIGAIDNASANNELVVTTTS
ncbi:hypothetical protein SDC9_190398 [bioreactor metagenome]|uniref:Uncharacterized protein n=1 Tax=bioreactor metagenome TaxID=1076179 RepID=A0A645HVG5_9ZZZZ